MDEPSGPGFQHCSFCRRALSTPCRYCPVCGEDQRRVPGLEDAAFAERYEVLRRLGQGDRQTTLLAVDRQLDRKVVLLEIRPDLCLTEADQQTFRENLQVVRDLSAADIEPVHGLVRAGSWHFLALRFRQGQTLATILERQPSLSPEQAVRLLEAALGLLERLHGRFPPVLHLNLGPGTLLLSDWHQVSLLGGAWLRVLGNPRHQRACLSPYLAPEQLLGRACPASDVYALGLTVLAAVTGLAPASIYLAANARFSTAGLPHPWLGVVLERMLAAPLGERYSTAREALEDCDRLSAGTGVRPAKVLPTALPLEPPEPTVRAVELVPEAVEVVRVVAMSPAPDAFRDPEDADLAEGFEILTSLARPLPETAAPVREARETGRAPVTSPLVPAPVPLQEEDRAPMSGAGKPALEPVSRGRDLARGPRRPGAASEPASLLVVEDDPTIAQTLEFMLSRDGFEVRVALDGRAAIAHIQDGAPPRAILLDLLLPFVDGFQLIDTIRRKPGWAHVPILMLTSNSQEQDISRALALGANDYIVKPFQLGELIARLRRYCQVPS